MSKEKTRRDCISKAIILDGVPVRKGLYIENFYRLSGPESIEGKFVDGPYNFTDGYLSKRHMRQQYGDNETLSKIIEKLPFDDLPDPISISPEYSPFKHFVNINKNRKTNSTDIPTI